LYNFTPVLLYGMTKWSDLFNTRQKLVFVTIMEKMKNVYSKMLKSGISEEYAQVIITYLAFIRDRLLDYNTTLCVWVPGGGFIAHTFGRQALPMVWDYFEVNPFNSSTGGWASSEGWIYRVIDHLSKTGSKPAKVIQSSATKLPFDDEFFDAVFTDPPYYDNVPYAVLSDFFYVWLKRDLGEYYPDLFSIPLAPKSEEAIADLPLLRGMSKIKAQLEIKNIKTNAHFENSLLQSFNEIERVLKTDGIAVIVYAHKSTDGWETLINSLLNSGLVITGAWPINTERKGRLRANESAALASSIYMIVRKWKKEELGFYRDVKYDLKKHLDNRLKRLWDEGISGADFFISGIGSSLEIFGKYKKIVDDDDNIVDASRLLEDVRKIVTDFAIHQVLHNGFSEEVSQMTRFYILWRWAYGNTKVAFDDALKMTQGMGINLEQEWNNGFIKKEKEFIRVLGPIERKLDKIKSKEMIDVLHEACLLWKQSKKEKMIKLLQESGFGNSDVFYKVAQAISESNPGSSESKLLDGFLSGKSKIMEGFNEQNEQTKLL